MPSDYMTILKKVREVLKNKGTLRLAKNITDAIYPKLFQPQECPSCGVWRDLDKPQESKWCECKEPRLTGTHTIPEVCKICEKPIQCYDCNKPIKQLLSPQPELPEKFYTSDHAEDSCDWEVRVKINEILRYLTERVR